MLDKISNFLQHPFIEVIINLIKKLKASKSYWSVSYFVLFFTLREAIAWKWGMQIELFVKDKLKNDLISEYEEFFWKIIELIFVNGSIQLIILGVIIFIILSLVKVSEASNSNITFRENYLVVFLLLFILGISLFQVNKVQKDDYLTQIYQETKEIKKTIKEATSVQKNQEKLNKITDNKIEEVLEIIVENKQQNEYYTDELETNNQKLKKVEEENNNNIEEVLEEIVENKKQNDYFIDELNQKNKEIEALIVEVKELNERLNDNPKYKRITNSMDYTIQVFISTSQACYNLEKKFYEKRESRLLDSRVLKYQNKVILNCYKRVASIDMNEINNEFYELENSLKVLSDVSKLKSLQGQISLIKKLLAKKDIENKKKISDLEG